MSKQSGIARVTGLVALGMLLAGALFQARAASPEANFRTTVTPEARPARASAWKSATRTSAPCFRRSGTTPGT